MKVCGILRSNEGRMCRNPLKLLSLTFTSASSFSSQREKGREELMESCRTFCLKRSSDFLSKRGTANLRQSCWEGTTWINTSFSLLPLSSLHLGSSLAVLNLQLKIELICVIHTVQLPSQRSWWMQECKPTTESEGTARTSASNCILGRGFSKLPSTLIVC